MSSPNRNHLWARAVAQELARSGVRCVCLTPGSRNTPLTVALTRHPETEVLPHLDERAASFFALGRGALGGRPAAVVTTSGTAAAECHPAVLEADRARVPLLVLTADRPPDLQDSGANQTVDQTGLYGNAVRWFWQAPEPEADPRKVRSLRTAVCRAVETTTGSPPGPVHLNLPFRKPLEPTPVPGDVPEDFVENHPTALRGRSEGEPFLRSFRGRSHPPEAARRRLAETIAGTRRGLIVAGPTPPAFAEHEALLELAALTGFPVLANPMSNLRFRAGGGDSLVLGAYDALLDVEAAVDLPAPELILRFGAAPTASAALGEYLSRVDARQWVIDPGGGWPEASFRAETVLRSDPAPLVRVLCEELDPREPGAWTRRWLDLERTYWSWVQEVRGGRPDRLFEGFLWPAILDVLPEDGILFTGNSLPVRDLIRFGRPGSAGPQVLANRGASGIDGNLSTALGAGAGTDRPLVVVMGDLALYHDLNALLLPNRLDVECTVVVVNNDGGGIFYRLPVREYDPPFTDYVRTPHGLDFRAAADQFDLGYERPGTLRSFEDALGKSLERPGSRLLEVVTDAERDQAYRRRLQEDLTEVLR